MNKILELNQECIDLCGQLEEIFERERTCLIQFKSEDLQANNMEKEQILGRLVERKDRLRHELTQVFGENGAETKPQEWQQWQTERTRWAQAWEQLVRKCEASQDFLKHSLRNIDLLSENLRRLFGVHSTYNAKGARIDSTPKATVVEGRY